MPRLYLLRHAKSDWGDDDLDDHERPLAPRGERAAVDIGDYLNGQGVRLDKVLVSSARRALDTWSLLGPRLDNPPQPEVARDLYLCGPGHLLARAQATDESVGSLMIVAHNPDLQQLTRMLAGPNVRPSPELSKFPTCACACIELDDWPSLSAGGSRLAWLITPKTLP